jgi:hypothetical protein
MRGFLSVSGFSRRTLIGLEVRCSIHLSYRRSFSILFPKVNVGICRSSVKEDGRFFPRPGWNFSADHPAGGFGVLRSSVSPLSFFPVYGLRYKSFDRSPFFSDNAQNPVLLKFISCLRV